MRFAVIAPKMPAMITQIRKKICAWIPSYSDQIRELFGEAEDAAAGGLRPQEHFEDEKAEVLESDEENCELGEHQNCSFMSRNQSL